ncbi:hypothetical protein H3146_23415 [Streptomyces sp. OF3]|uniref:Uncharacterized protein n=1 Tax=Streptomyces alkaliterrae TaxID=2213162 RepID=A0A7W3WPX0_9ACTN|nr:hypothetical protein [Streptomyces alkaliterrae]MBB1256281.1 hypothetical protein [Streptomyces alkaliterrae]
MKLASTGVIVSAASTSGKKAPVTVRGTKNLKEGTKIYYRGCVTKAGKNHGCTNWRPGNV